MVAIAKENILMFQLRNNLYSQLEIPLQNAIELLSNDIKTLLLSDKKIERQSEEMLAQVFNLRIKALKWLSVNSDNNILEVIKDITPQIEEFSENPQLETLTENILFALRCNKRVAEGVIGMQLKNNQIENSTNVAGFGMLDIDYNVFKASLQYINDAFSEKIRAFVNASLHIEWVILATDIISESKMVLSDEKINELCFLVVDVAQEYTALAMQLGYLVPRSKKIEEESVDFEVDFIKEQKELADLGLEDWINL